ncbi:MAG TPA: SIS domain-containing protein [Candidatus Limnocylindria bacterium]|nr:SIS domain-containing protein [Candidatus Limnocylindria bacterium]
MAFDPEAPLPGAPDPWAGSTMPPLRDGAPYAMTEMIAAEPALAERLARRLATDPAVEMLVAWVRDAMAARAPVTILGCGTSEHAAEGIAAMWREVADIDARHAQALETLAGPQRDGLVVAISHEGGTRATNDALQAAREAGARTALISVSDRSPGAAIAELTVQTGEQDTSWCHTVGYLSPLVAGAAVAGHLAGAQLEATAVRALLQVGDSPDADAVAARLAACDRLLVSGSGPDHATARELALKVAEGAHLPAHALHLETILHGHLAATDRRTGFVLVLTSASLGVVERARRVLAAIASLGMPAAALIGADLGDDVPRELTPAGRLAVPETSRLPRVPASLLGAAVPLQLLAERLARARGTNPDTIGREDPAQAAAHH